MVHHHMPGLLEPVSLFAGVCMCGRIIIFFSHNVQSIHRHVYHPESICFVVSFVVVE